MASPGSSGSNSNPNPNMTTEDRQRKRKESNRESARRSRMKKQRHVEDLTAQIDNLRKNNSRLISITSETTEKLLKVETENSVLRIQVEELTSRLQYLNEINGLLSVSVHGVYSGVAAEDPFPTVNDFVWNYYGSCLNQPFMASSGEIFQC